MRVLSLNFLVSRCSGWQWERNRSFPENNHSRSWFDDWNVIKKLQPYQTHFVHICYNFQPHSLVDSTRSAFQCFREIISAIPIHCLDLSSGGATCWTYFDFFADFESQQHTKTLSDWKGNQNAGYEHGSWHSWWFSASSSKKVLGKNYSDIISFVLFDKTHSVHCSTLSVPAIGYQKASTFNSRRHSE